MNRLEYILNRRSSSHTVHHVHTMVVLIPHWLRDPHILRFFSSWPTVRSPDDMLGMFPTKPGSRWRVTECVVVVRCGEILRFA